MSPPSTRSFWGARSALHPQYLFPDNKEHVYKVWLTDAFKFACGTHTHTYIFLRKTISFIDLGKLNKVITTYCNKNLCPRCSAREHTALESNVAIIIH